MPRYVFGVLFLSGRQPTFKTALGHHDASTEYTSVEDAVTATQMALEEGLGGMMTWDINRDCRSGYQT